MKQIAWIILVSMVLTLPANADELGESTQLNNTHHANPFAMLSHALLAPLMQPLRCLKSCIIFIHQTKIGLVNKS
jgi:hypothetical protein